MDNLMDWYNTYIKMGYTPQQFQDMLKAYTQEGVNDLPEMLRKNYMYETVGQDALTYLQNQAPELFTRVNNYAKEYNLPIYRALRDYQIPSMIADGYDLNLFNEEIPFNDQASLGTITPFLYNTDAINNAFNRAPESGFLYENAFNFPSDGFTLDSLNSKYFKPSATRAPALYSAFNMLKNNPNIY